MQRRLYDRIPASLVVKFLYSGSVCYGLITDLSENGMCINTGMCLPSGSHAKLFLPLKEEILEISAMVRRVVKTDGFYDTMGVELLDPPKKYLQIVESFRAALKLA